MAVYLPVFNLDSSQHLQHPFPLQTNPRSASSATSIWEWADSCQIFRSFWLLEYYFFILVIKALFISVVDEVRGYCWLKGETDLANKPPTKKIFLHSKFGINRTAGLKVMAKKLFWPQDKHFGHNFWASGPIDPQFRVWKICMVGGFYITLH